MRKRNSLSTLKLHNQKIVCRRGQEYVISRSRLSLAALLRLKDGYELICQKRRNCLLEKTSRIFSANEATLINNRLKYTICKSNKKFSNVEISPNPIDEIRILLNLIKSLQKEINLIQSELRKELRDLRKFFTDYHSFHFKNLDDYHPIALTLRFES